MKTEDISGFPNLTVDPVSYTHLDVYKRQAVILPRLNEQQREIYTVMQQLKGNKPYLWEGIYNGGEDTGPSYEIPLSLIHI